MKLFKKLYTSALMLGVLASTAFTGCQKADPEFTHEDNLISQMIAMGGRQGSETQFIGTIYEYDANGQILPADFTFDEAIGGSGVITFVIPYAQKDDIDLTSCYLRATLTYDEMVYPTLSGRHNILVTEENPEGLVFSVKSGTGKVRKYRVMGIYE